MKMFTSLEDLNKFLTEELGLAPLSQEMVDQGIAVAMAQASPNVEEATASFSFQIPDQEDAQEEPSVIDEDAFNSYVEFSSEQIARLTRERDTALSQRDEAVAATQQEIREHMECHEHMETYLHQIRVQGYAEALAAGLFPGVPFETLKEEHQEVLMRQAHDGIDKIDGIRADIATARQVSPTTH